MMMISMGLLRLPTSTSCFMMMSSSSSQPPHHNNLSRLQQDFVRPLANFSESVSADPFTSYTLDPQVLEGYGKEIEPLKEEARKMLLKECKAVDKLYLIDNIERLGLSYHFEDEIEEQLQLLFNEVTNGGGGGSAATDDLSTVALEFRLFRQHGYPISSDIFNQFTNGNGKFNKCLESDVKGLLNLYEASYVRSRKDVILDEALCFTRDNLLSIRDSREEWPGPGGAYIDRLVKHALHQCLHRGFPRLEARHFIDAYEHDEMQNASLLRFAKLDFNLLQLLYRQELSVALRWWKEMDIASNVPYARNRPVESYMWALGMFYEPKYAAARLIYYKYVLTGTFIDDTYDAYAILDEIDMFTSAMQRWDKGEADRLPGYMKNAFTIFLKTNKEIEQCAIEKGRPPYAFHYLQESWKEYARHSDVQSRWFVAAKEEESEEVVNLPSFDEYMVDATITAAGKVNVCASILLMESANEDVFQWLFQNPLLLHASNIIMRLENDVAGYQNEKERGAPNSIPCYMKSFNVSEEEAKRRLLEMVDDAWKDINEEYCRKPTMPITKEILTVLINQTRLSHVCHKNRVDSWTDPGAVFPRIINQIFMDPFTI